MNERVKCVRDDWTFMDVPIRDASFLLPRKGEVYHVRGAQECVCGCGEPMLLLAEEPKDIAYRVDHFRPLRHEDAEIERLRGAIRCVAVPVEIVIGAESE
jgi:hypothetical protein